VALRQKRMRARRQGTDDATGAKGSGDRWWTQRINHGVLSSQGRIQAGGAGTARDGGRRRGDRGISSGIFCIDAGAHNGAAACGHCTGFTSRKIRLPDFAAGSAGVFAVARRSSAAVLFGRGEDGGRDRARVG